MNQTLTFQEFSGLFQTEIMFEVAYTRSPVLKQIDELFRELKINKKSTTIHRQLEKRIKEFTGIKKVLFAIEEDVFNAGIIPKYKNNLPDLLNEMKRTKSKMYAEETPKYIDYAIVIMGDRFIDGHSYRELTAILLHEIGHLYQYTANLSLYLSRGLFKASLAAFNYGGPLMGIASLFNPAVLPLLLATYTLSRTMSYFEHVNEFDADSYASKYGYGEEIANAHIKDYKYAKKINAKDSWLERLWSNMKQFILPSSHPTDRDRICSLIEKMKNDHKKIYPKMKNKFNIIYADLKC